MRVMATCNEGRPDASGVFHDLRELQVAEARMTMFNAVAGFNAEEGLDVEVRWMRQCARCALLFTEFAGPDGQTLLFVHLPPEGLMV